MLMVRYRGGFSALLAQRELCRAARHGDVCREHGQENFVSVYILISARKLAEVYLSCLKEGRSVKVSE